MSRWPTKQLSALCDEITVGFVGKMSDQYVEKGIPFLRSQDIFPGHIDVANIKYISQGFHQKIRKSKLTPGDVAVVRTGYPGTAAVVPASLPEANCADLVILRPGSQLDPRFLAYVFNSPWGKAHVGGRLVGAAQQHFNVKTAQALEIPTPPFDIQCRIASILGAYDDLIEVNQRRVKLLEEMARGLFEEWFVRFRYPGHEAVPLLDTPNGPLPEGWRWGVFENLTDEIRQSVAPSDVDAETSYIGLEHLPRRSTTLNDRGNAVDVSSLKLRFQRGDILFGKIRPYFHKVAWAPIGGVCSTDAIVWRPKPGATAQALAIASSDDFVAHSVQTSNGTKMPRANPRVLAAYRCAIATPDISARFECVSFPLVELAAALQAANERLAASRDLLLPRLISGQLSVEAVEQQLAAE